jgi:hypothetical protein
LPAELNHLADDARNAVRLHVGYFERFAAALPRDAIGLPYREREHAISEGKGGGYTPENWVLVTLGRLEPAKVREALQGNPLLRQIAPLFLLSSNENWLSVDSVDIDLKFLIKQNL